MPRKSRRKKETADAQLAVANLPTTLEEVERQLARVRARLAQDDAAADSDKMPPAVYAKLSTELRGWTKLRNEIESKAAITEDKIASHPKFIELRDAIVTALAPHPDALQAVVDALRA